MPSTWDLFHRICFAFWICFKLTIALVAAILGLAALAREVAESGGEDAGGFTLTRAGFAWKEFLKYAGRGK